MNHPARRFSALSAFDLAKTAPLALGGDKTDDLRLVTADPCRRCGHDNERHLRQGFHPGERDQRCVPGCECRAFREPWGALLRAQGLGILLGLIVSLLIIALVIGVLS